MGRSAECNSAIQQIANLRYPFAVLPYALRLLIAPSLCLSFALGNRKVHLSGARISSDMIELIQFPWSPFCIVQRRILEFSGAPFKITNIPNGDRSLIWRLTRERYYGVPIIRDGRSVIFEVSEDSQVIAKYLDTKLGLGLFPWVLEGAQSIIWRYIENEIEAVGFKLNDVYWQEMVPASDRVRFLRHKERKFGRGCLDDWRAEQKELLAKLEHRLVPFEEMLLFKPFLLDDRPRFVDFDLYGMLANFLYSGHYHLPSKHTEIRDWYQRMAKVRMDSINADWWPQKALPDRRSALRGGKKPASHASPVLRSSAAEGGRITRHVSHRPNSNQ